jgi:hypothetical protein
LNLDQKDLVSSIDIDNLKSLYLTENKEFKYLLSELQNWNLEVAKGASRDSVPKQKLKYELMKLLCQNLRDVVDTKSRPL